MLDHEGSLCRAGATVFDDLEHVDVGHNFKVEGAIQLFGLLVLIVELVVVDVNVAAEVDVRRAEVNSVGDRLCRDDVFDCVVGKELKVLNINGEANFRPIELELIGIRSLVGDPFPIEVPGARRDVDREFEIGELFIHDLAAEGDVTADAAEVLELNVQIFEEVELKTKVFHDVDDRGGDGSQVDIHIVSVTVLVRRCEHVDDGADHRSVNAREVKQIRQTFDFDDFVVRILELQNAVVCLGEGGGEEALDEAKDIRVIDVLVSVTVIGCVLDIKLAVLCALGSLVVNAAKLLIAVHQDETDLVVGLGGAVDVALDTEAVVLAGDADADHAVRAELAGDGVAGDFVNGVDGADEDLVHDGRRAAVIPKGPSVAELAVFTGPVVVLNDLFVDLEDLFHGGLIRARPSKGDRVLTFFRSGSVLNDISRLDGIVILIKE